MEQFAKVSGSFSELIIVLVELLLACLQVSLFVVPIVLLFYFKKKRYEKSAYHQITKLPYSFVKSDKGRYGEYLIYKKLEQFEKQGAKFLFNVYIPTEDGGTTEIDILMLYEKGIFVFESKNYGGWIFGNEENRKWCQTFPSGHKEQFYNPIMQNKTHILHLQEFLYPLAVTRSMIVFSDRCVLKSLKIKSKDVSVLNCNNVGVVLSRICASISEKQLSEDDISKVYDKLYPYTQMDETKKQMHIQNVNQRVDGQFNKPY